MTRLPEPLPYDFVDEMIDSVYEFSQVPIQNGTMVKHIANRRDSESRGNYTRPLISLVTERSEADLPEDEEGYYDDSHDTLGGYRWTAKELSDWQIDAILP